MDSGNAETLSEAEAKVRHGDRVRESFLHVFYGVSPNTTKYFDLIIQTDRFPRESAAKWIKEAAECRADNDLSGGDSGFLILKEGRKVKAAIFYDIVCQDKESDYNRTAVGNINYVFTNPELDCKGDVEKLYDQFIEHLESYSEKHGVERISIFVEIEKVNSKKESKDNPRLDTMDNMVKNAATKPASSTGKVKVTIAGEDSVAEESAKVSVTILPPGY